MRTVILCGGLGTRLAEETDVKPKPMVEIGGFPILWHVMRMYGSSRFTDFVLALGYKGHVIKDYFLNYRCHSQSLSVDLKSGEVTVHSGPGDEWNVHMLDTGLNTMTGGRVKRVAEFVGRETFMMTYGDGLGDVDIGALLAFHRRCGKLATVTAVRPPARFGGLQFDGDLVTHFVEKPQIGEGWINGGFFVLDPAAIDYIDGDSTVWERDPMERLAADGQLAAYRHDGFWQCMDTLRDVLLLRQMWADGKAPWAMRQGRGLV